jgi:hypothetical protein
MNPLDVFAIPLKFSDNFHTKKLAITSKDLQTADICSLEGNSSLLRQPFRSKVTYSLLPSCFAPKFYYAKVLFVIIKNFHISNFHNVISLFSFRKMDFPGSIYQTMVTDFTMNDTRIYNFICYVSDYVINETEGCYSYPSSFLNELFQLIQFKQQIVNYLILVRFTIVYNL